MESLLSLLQEKGLTSQQHLCLSALEANPGLLKPHEWANFVLKGHYRKIEF